MKTSKRPSPELLAKISTRYESGESFHQIGVSLGLAKNTIRKYLLANGIKSNRGRSISRATIGRAGSQLGKIRSAAHCAKLSEALKGRGPGRVGPHSEETKLKISAALRTLPKKYTDEENKHRERIRQACKRFVRRILISAGKRKIGTVQEIVGYSKDELVAHLGPRPADAHIDHIVPIAEFLRRGITDPAAINALPNLRWLGAYENRKKSANIPPDADKIISACLTRSAA
jgi:hypothetical protein